jgi:glycosyltransferase involved in cell wall biosynthesis
MMKTFVVIPAYNESKKIGSVLSNLKKAGYSDIVVVDDGSKDNTYGIAKSMAYAVQHSINRGQGAAIKTGIEYALSKKADIIVTYDADGQFLVEDIGKIIAPIMNDKADITLGSRFLGKAVNIPWSKKLVLKLGVVFVLILYGIRITDSQCGLRAMTKNAAREIRLTSDRMEHAADFFSEIMRNKLKYVEVPITVIYDKYSIGKGQDWTRSINLGINMMLKKLMR